MTKTKNKKEGPADTWLKKDDGNGGNGGTGGSGAAGGVASADTGKKMSVEGTGSSFGGESSKVRSSGVGTGGKVMGTGWDMFNYSFLLSNVYLNMQLLLDIFVFLFQILNEFIFFCSLTTRKERIDRERKRMSDIQELGLL